MSVFLTPRFSTAMAAAVFKDFMGNGQGPVGDSGGALLRLRV